MHINGANLTPAVLMWPKGESDMRADVWGGPLLNSYLILSAL